MDDATVPRGLNATCVGCSPNEDVRRPFDLTDSDPGEVVAVFECLNCGHEIRLELDP